MPDLLQISQKADNLKNELIGVRDYLLKEIENDSIKYTKSDLDAVIEGIRALRIIKVIFE